MAANASAPETPDLSTIPAVPPPPGVLFDFNNPDNYKSENIIMHSIILSIITIMVAIRLYTRGVMKKSMGIDDCEYLKRPLGQRRLTENRSCDFIMGKNGGNAVRLHVH